ncbi:MAG: hypothetical protein R2785_05110 [Flavobacteriaceae bacterium]
MKRKTFLKKTAGVLMLAAPAYMLLNCSKSDDSGSNNNNNQGSDPDCIQNGTNTNITANHGHSLTVSVADVNAGTEKTYNIEGSAGHSHEVTVTAANFNSLANNQQVVLSSTNDNGHTHNVTISCAT